MISCLPRSGSMFAPVFQRYRIIFIRNEVLMLAEPRTSQSSLMATRTSPLSRLEPRNPACNAAVGLPELPRWFVAAFIGGCTFVLLVAVVLLVIQWPRGVKWIGEWQFRQRPRSCERASEDDGVECDLSVDTNARYHGLGITIAGQDQETATRGFFTPRTMPQRLAQAEPPQCRASHPSISSLAKPPPSRSSSPRAVHHLDATRKTSSSAISKHASPGPMRAVGEDRGHQSSVAQNCACNTFIPRLGNGIFHGVEMVAQTFFDLVFDPEEGLLLPIQEGQREDGTGGRTA